MRPALMLGLALVAIFWLHPVEPLASEASFNSRFRRCLPNYRDAQFGNDNKRILGQTIPTGFTLHSFISTVERFERKYIRPGAPAREAALALLHWFSLPDFAMEAEYNRVIQKSFARNRYDLVKPLFNDELRTVADMPLNQNLANDDLDDQCFLMRALSHTYENVCPQGSNATNRLPQGQNGQENFFGNKQQDSSMQQQNRFQSNLNNQRQRGYPLGGANQNNNYQSNSNNQYNGNNNNYNGNNNNNYNYNGNNNNYNNNNGNNYNSQMPNRQAAVPNLRNSQAHLLSFTRSINQNCALREDGVVSITGLQGDAIAMGPVLMGIAASRVQYNGRDQWNQNDNFEHQALNIEKNPLYLATLGQEIGMAAFLRLVDDVDQVPREAQRHDFDVTGNWEYPGCLLAHYLDTKRSVAFSRAQMSGAIDGAVIGNMLTRPDLETLSLSEVLRLYYSNNYVRVESQIASVCNRGTLYNQLDAGLIARQAELVAFHLAQEHGLLTEYFNEISSKVMNAIQSIDQDLSNEWKSEICPRNNLEQCTGQADLHVILDSSSQNVEVRKRQANILGRIVNGMDFRERRNTVHVYSGYSGNGLRKYPDNFSFQTEKQNDTYGFTASGCPACLAHHLEPSHEGRSDREIFVALNKTLNDLKSSTKRLSREQATAGRVVLYFRMSGEPIEDAKAVSDVLISMRIAHPEVRIIGIGDEETLSQINDRSRALKFYSDFALDKELREPRLEAGSRFEDIKNYICETPVNLQNVECYNSYNNNNNNNNNINNRNRNLGTNRDFQAGVNPRRVQFVSYDSHYFAGSTSEFTVQFSTGTNGQIKVCELSADYEYATPGQGISNQNNNNNNNNNRNDNGPHRNCFQTTSSMRSITYNYTRRCYDGRRSCAALRYAVVGLDSTSRVSASCKAPFCESPVSVAYSVRPDGMVCASSSILASLALIVTGLVVAMRLA